MLEDPVRQESMVQYVLNYPPSMAYIILFGLEFWLEHFTIFLVKW